MLLSAAQVLGPAAPPKSRINRLLSFILLLTPQSESLSSGLRKINIALSLFHDEWLMIGEQRLEFTDIKDVISKEKRDGKNSDPPAHPECPS